MRQIILDTETTGLDPSKGHRIIEIGCVELINRQLTNNNFHVYINPERAIDPGAQQVHGISNAFLADKPVFSKIFSDFLKFIDGAELIIHNAPFDVSFLNSEFITVGYKEKRLADHCSITDTLALARQMHPGQRNSLDALCKRYSIDNSHRELHGALLDSTILAQVYLAMTGGQASLFGEENTISSVSVAKTTQKKKQIEKIDLPVLLATAEELEMHQKQLESIKEKNGKCIWLEEPIA